MAEQIMIVDDKAGILTLLSILLRRRGFDVLKAQTAYEALDLLEAATPVLFLIDMKMPGMNGAELCERIRNHPQVSETPIIIVSVLNDPATVRAGFEAGANAYLDKTTIHEDLMPTVYDLLGREGTSAQSPSLV